MNVTSPNGTASQVYYLTDLLGARVFVHGKKIGRLDDLVMVEGSPFPEVTKLCVHRPYGEPSLLIPWEKVRVLKIKEIVVSIDDLKEYIGAPQTSDILLGDHVLDKKVLDTEDREVEIVYDVKLAARGNKLYVCDVNISHYRFLRRLGLKWLANIIYAFRQKSKDTKIPWQYIQPLPPNIGSFKGDVKLTVLKEMLEETHPADLADIIEELDRGQRVAIFNQLEPETASDTLEEIDPNVQRDLVPALKKERVSQLLNSMTPGQAADVLSVLPHNESRAILEVLKSINPKHAKKVESILSTQEEQIANFTTTKIITVREDMPVHEARELYNNVAKDKVVYLYLYITDVSGKLLGVLNIRELLQAQPEQQMRDIMIENVISLTQQCTLQDALELFDRYDFRAIPVINESGILLGAIPFRDVKALRPRLME